MSFYSIDSETPMPKEVAQEISKAIFANAWVNFLLHCFPERNREEAENEFSLLSPDEQDEIQTRFVGQLLLSICSAAVTEDMSRNQTFIAGIKKSMYGKNSLPGSSH